MMGRGRSITRVIFESIEASRKRRREEQEEEEEEEDDDERYRKMMEEEDELLEELEVFKELEEEDMNKISLDGSTWVTIIV